MKKWYFNYARGYVDNKQYERASSMYERLLYTFDYDLEAGLESTGLYELIDKKVDKQDNARLMFLEEVRKLQDIEEGAQRNYITAVDSSNFTVTEAGTLNLKEVKPSQVTGLVAVLDSKVDKKEGWGLSQNNFSNYYKGYIDNLIEIEGSLGFVTQEEFDETVGDMKGFAQYVGKETTTIADELYDLNERLSWQDVEKEENENDFETLNREYQEETGFSNLIKNENQIELIGKTFTQNIDTEKENTFFI